MILSFSYRLLAWAITIAKHIRNVIRSCYIIYILKHQNETQNKKELAILSKRSILIHDTYDFNRMNN